jgi:preprotein translocase subunit SecD
MPLVIREFGKAGLTGLFALSALALMPSIGAAQLPPLRIQVEKAVAAFHAKTSEPVIVIHMTPRSGRMFHELTLKNVGRKLALRIDGNVVSEPIIREPVTSGVVQISGSFTKHEAADLAERLSKGEAKIEVQLVD